MIPPRPDVAKTTALETFLGSTGFEGGGGGVGVAMVTDFVGFGLLMIAVDTMVTTTVLNADDAVEMMAEKQNGLRFVCFRNGARRKTL